MKRNLVGLAAALGVTAMSSWASAVEYDPFDMKAVLASAEDKVLDSGKSALTDVGKRLLGAALDAYSPGLGSVLGLSGKEDTSTQQLLDAIAADGNKTRDLVRGFWDYEIAHNGLALQNHFDDALIGITLWNQEDPRYRIQNREQLSDLVKDCTRVVTEFKSGVTPLDRVRNLHAYVTLLDLTISLVAERAELNYVGGMWEYEGAEDFDLWWASKTQEERDDIVAEITNKKRAAVAVLLQAGLGFSFEGYLQGMDYNSDFTAARNQQFSSIIGPSGGGSHVWTYYVGNDPQGNCLNHTTYCKTFTITEGSTGTNGTLYYVDYNNYGRMYYKDADEAYQEHKAFVLKDMILRGYGPVRALAEVWWDTWGFGWRNRIALDDAIDGYVFTADGTVANLQTVQTQNSMSVGEAGYLYGFALTWGLSAVDAISGSAYRNPDWLDTLFYHNGLVFTRFPSSMHFNAMRSWPMTSADVDSLYRGLPAAKLAAVQAAL
jgi:hypothetical protein